VLCFVILIFINLEKTGELNFLAKELQSYHCNFIPIILNFREHD